MKPVALSMQWLEASSNIVEYNWLKEEKVNLDLKTHTCGRNICLEFSLNILKNNN